MFSLYVDGQREGTHKKFVYLSKLICGRKIVDKMKQMMVIRNLCQLDIIVHLQLGWDDSASGARGGRESSRQWSQMRNQLELQGTNVQVSWQHLVNIWVNN